MKDAEQKPQSLISATIVEKCAAIYVLKVQKGLERVKRHTSAKTAGPNWIKERNSKVHSFTMHIKLFLL